MPSPLSIVTLLTDFGDRDYFVASMKGVVLNINPQARIVDLTHQIAPHGIHEAAYFLKSCYRYFPDGTIHVAIVDPGVGSARRPLLVNTSRYFFLAPDNGLLTHIFEEELDMEVRQIENRQYRLDAEGHTFDGRDLFAPAAAWLTKGQSMGSFGRLIRDYTRLTIPRPRWEQKAMTGEIVYVDRFGNLISNLTQAQLTEVRHLTKRTDPSIRIGPVTIEGLVGSYSEGSPDKPHALINSNGQLEIFVKEGSAARQLKLARGEQVILS